MDIDIQRLARLANMNVSPSEEERLRRQLPVILEYVGSLQDVDISGVDPKAYLTSAVNVLRDDVPTSTSEERNAVVAAFPKSVGDALEVPGVFAD